MQFNSVGISIDDYNELISYNKNELPANILIDEPANLPAIYIARIRHFFDFESLNVVNHIEEITFFNDISDQNRIQYYAPDFKEYLNVYDFNGEKLQFHGNLEDYFEIQVEDDTQSKGQQEFIKESNRDFPFEIVIDFPKNKPLLSKEFRTLSFIDKLDIESSIASYPMIINVPFDQAIHNYVYIKKMPQYEAIFKTAFYQRNTQDPYFSLNFANEKPNLGEYRTSSFYTIYSYVPINNCDLVIFVKHKLKTQDSLWFYGGVVLGIGVIIINFLLLLLNPHNYLQQITAIGALAVSYLVITKGWIFMKDIDDVVDIFQRDTFKISFTLVYLLLIVVIMIEIATAAYYSQVSNSNFQGNLTIIIQKLYHHI